MDAKDRYKVVVVTPDGTRTEASGGSMLCVVQERGGKRDLVQENVQTLISGRDEDLLDMVLQIIECIELRGSDNFGATVLQKLKQQAHYTGYIRAY